MARDRQDRERARAAACAEALGVRVAELNALYQADREGLRRRLEAAGVDPATGHPLRAQGRPGRPTSASSVAQAAGIPVPDLGVGRLRSVADRDVGVEPTGNAWSPRDDQIVDESSAADQGVDELVDAGLGVDADQPVDADTGGHEPADLTPESATVDAAS
jgi:hypothetical protein